MALAALQSLLEAGLLYPQLFPLGPEGEQNQPLAGKSRIKEFDYWLAQALPPIVFAHPAIVARVLGERGLLPECPSRIVVEGPKPQEADGVEWLLRLGVLWQQVAASPLRRTQQRDFFKRDLDRLQADPLLSMPPSDSLVDLPDSGLFTVALGLATGVLEEQDGEIRAGTFPEEWTEGLASTIAHLWSRLPRLESWNPARGWQVALTPGNPYTSANLLSLVLLGDLPANTWADPEALEEWLIEHHPFWSSGPPGESAESRQARPARRNATRPRRRLSASPASCWAWRFRFVCCKRRRTVPGRVSCACRRWDGGSSASRRSPANIQPFPRRCSFSPTWKSSPIARA